jgi:hypothetical protein
MIYFAHFFSLLFYIILSGHTSLLYPVYWFFMMFLKKAGNNNCNIILEDGGVKVNNIKCKRRSYNMVE